MKVIESYKAALENLDENLLREVFAQSGCRPTQSRGRTGQQCGCEQARSVAGHG